MDTDIKTQNNYNKTLQQTLSNGCHCTCPVLFSNYTATEEQLYFRLINLREELHVDKKYISAYRNTKISAGDSRPTSKYMGVVGRFVILIPVVFIVSCDLLNAFYSIQ